MVRMYFSCSCSGFSAILIEGVIPEFVGLGEEE
jgi:hypothetical protein